MKTDQTHVREGTSSTPPIYEPITLQQHLVVPSIGRSEQLMHLAVSDDTAYVRRKGVMGIMVSVGSQKDELAAHYSHRHTYVYRRARAKLYVMPGSS